MMPPAIRRVRELVVSYRPLRVPLPVTGTASGPHFDTKHTLIGIHVVSVGTLDASLVHPREVFKAAYLSNASALILAHNHPSGDPTPSGEDRALSDRLRQAGELLGITLLDFVIVTDPAEGFRYHSFKESGVL